MSLAPGTVFGLLPAVSALGLDTGGLYPEVAAVAYHFHWSRRECMDMSRRERRRWLDEIERINKAITKGMRGKR